MHDSAVRTPLTFGLADDADGRFTIDPTTGAVSVAADAQFDPEGGQLTLLVQYTDSTGRMRLAPVDLTIESEHDAKAAEAADAGDTNVTDAAWTDTFEGTEPDAIDSVMEQVESVSEQATRVAEMSRPATVGFEAPEGFTQALEGARQGVDSVTEDALGAANNRSGRRGPLTSLKRFFMVLAGYLPEDERR